MLVHLLCEGTSIRACERLTQINRNTILSLIESVGHRCASLLSQKLVNLPTQHIEIDELWTYVFCKDWKAQGGPKGRGDQYLYLALCPDTKLILNHLVAKRHSDCADEFMARLKSRLGTQRVQISTDCWMAYTKQRGSIYQTFGENVDYGTIWKEYGKAIPGQVYCAKVIKNIHKKAVFGNPDTSRICTSYIERQNASVRLFNKRFGRLTTCFSKKLENLKHSAELYVAYTNFCRTHSTLRIGATETSKATERTPAMAAGITDHIWTIEEILTFTGNSN